MSKVVNDIILGIRAVAIDSNNASQVPSFSLWGVWIKILLVALQSKHLLLSFIS
jgi:hypothetical protein